MAFSGALTLTDLNDFITPSQACIKPVEQTNKPEVQARDPGAAATQIQVDSSGSYYEVSNNFGPTLGTSAGTKQKLTTAEISLNDCLACSGCITSAESVLITMQSHAEVLNFLTNNPRPPNCHYRVPVISIAPQSLASLAATVSSSSSQSVGLLQILRRTSAFCRDVLGFEHVYDTTFARHISLLEHAKEFAERRSGSAGEGKLPMLASACPGWVCYAEKTHGEMLPFISRTKSPQQVMGTLVKEWLAAKWGKTPDQIYHVTVMPCYDKKLEASRQDFYNEAYATRDVDCVLTTGELQLLMLDKGWDLSVPVPDENVPRPFPSSPSSSASDALPELLMHPGTSSGSYLHTLLAAIRASAPDPDALELTTKRVRGGADYEEFTLAPRSGGPAVFSAAKCYGFRNLQNVVRKVGREAGVQVGRGAAGRLAGRGRAVRRGKGGAGEGKEEEKERGYDYVEVMACPGGCVNGGGQIRPPPQEKEKETETDAEGHARDWTASGVRLDAEESLPAAPTPASAKWGDREWTKKVEGAYWHTLPTPPPTPPADGRRGASTGAGAEYEAADELAARVLVEITKAAKRGEGEKVEWKTTLNEKAEERRRRLFRTEYRAVESEVVGLAVKW